MRAPVSSFNNKIIIKITESESLFHFGYDLVQNREFEKPVEDPNFFSTNYLYKIGISLQVVPVKC